jgi:hypothetical protein
MLPADLETLKEIAQQLSGRGVGEWVVEERGFNLSHLVGPDKATVDVCRSSNMWIFTADLYNARNDNKTIKISRDKPADTIAKELTRRLVDGFLPALCYKSLYDVPRGNTA